MRKIPQDKENPIDNIFYWLSENTASWYKKLHMTPNQITTLSLIAGVGSAYYYDKDKIGIAIGLFALAFYFDCLDGFYARKYKMTSKYGEMYDHIVDWVKHSAIIYVMYKKSPTKFYKTLPIIVIFLTLSMVHIGCQEKHYNNKDDQVFINYTQQLCPNKDNISYTRYVGVGTFELVFILIMWYLK
jgi:phosphatidylglycerophosphate synthase